MFRRHATWIALAGPLLACQQGPSMETCQQWDASVREVVAGVEAALPSDVKVRSFAEDYQLVAEDLELAGGLAACVEAGHLAALEGGGEVADPAPDLAFLDDLAFGSDFKTAARVMKDAGWSCKLGEPAAGIDKAQVCAGDYARGRAEVQLGFRAQRLVRASLAVRDIGKRTQEIVKATDADVFQARQALIEKVVADLGTRFPNLMQTRDGVEQGGVRMIWKGTEGSRVAQLEFAEKGPRLGFTVEDLTVAAHVRNAAASRPTKEAGSYFE